MLCTNIQTLITLTITLCILEGGNLFVLCVGLGLRCMCVFIKYSLGEKFYVSTQLDNLVPKCIYKKNIKVQLG